VSLSLFLFVLLGPAQLECVRVSVLPAKRTPRGPQQLGTSQLNERAPLVSLVVAFEFLFAALVSLPPKRLTN